MADIVAQLEVLARDNGCLIDLSAILDLSICPKVDIQSHKPHVVETKENYISVTPTTPQHQQTTHYKKRCDKKTCYEVQEPICHRPDIAMDLQMLVTLGLLSQEDLERYLKTTGALKEEDQYAVDDDDVCLDPTLSEWEYDAEHLYDHEAVDQNGLLPLHDIDQDNLHALLDKCADPQGSELRRRHCPGNNCYANHGHGNQGYGHGNNCPGNNCQAANNNNNWQSNNGHGHGNGGSGTDRLLDLDLISEKDPAGKEALIDLDILTGSRNHRRCQGNTCQNANGAWNPNHGNQNGGTDRLLDADIIGEKDYDEALIDVDVITGGRKHHRRCHGNACPGGVPGGWNGNQGNNRQGGTDRLLDADIISEKDYDEALIDVDVITAGRKHHPRDCTTAACRTWGNRPWGHSGWEKPTYPHGTNNNNGGTDRLLDLDLISEKDAAGKEALIDLDILTASRHHRRNANGADRLLDADIIGEKDPAGKEALIDLDILTFGNNNNRGPITPGYPSPDRPGHYDGGFLTHYRPVCNKGFRRGHRDNTERCHAHDVNHCLALCHARSAKLTLESNIQDVAQALLCAAVEYDDSIDDDNCRFFVAPESEPCRDEDLVESDNCVSFIRK